MHLHVLWHSAFSIFWPQSSFFHLPIRRYHNRAPPFLCQPKLFILLETNCKLLFPFWKPCPPENHWRSPFGCQKKCVAKTGQKAEMPRKTGPCMRTNACRARLNACLIEMKHTPSRQNGARRPWFYTVPPYRQRSCMPFPGRGRRSPLRLLCRFGALPAQKKPGTRPGLFLSPRQETGEALPKR